MRADKILLADAENNVRFSQYLADDGYLVTAAPDGHSVLQCLEQDAYEVVIIDAKLPDIDGLEVLRRIKTGAPWQRVIVMTGPGTVETAVEAMRRGAVDCLQKPITADELQQAVSRSLTPVNSQEAKQANSFAGYIAEAQQLLKQGKLDAASQTIHKAIQLDSGRPEGFNLLGALAELRGDQETARRMYRVALTVAPTYEPAAFNLNRVCQWNPAGRVSPINFGDRQEQELKMRDLIV